METQTGFPLEQSVAPRRHGLINMHGEPGLQLVHWPTLQKPAGHIVPSGTAPTVTQFAAPVEHSVTPFWHGLASAHATPGWHGVTQNPS